MNWKKWTIVFSLAIIIAIAAWDIWVTITPERNDTISEQFVIINKKFPLLGLLWGIITAHLAVQRTYWFGNFEKHRYKFLTGIVVLAAILSFFVSGWGPSLLFFVWGFFTGLIFWPQYRENF